MDPQTYGQAMMTHWPPQPNPAAPYLAGAMNFAGGGLQRALGLPNNFIGRALQNPDNQFAMGMAGVGRPTVALTSRLSNLEQQIKAGLDAGKSTYQVADEIGMSQSGLRHYTDRRGWHSAHAQVGGPEAKTSWPQDRDAMLKTLREQGLSYSEIADKMGLTRGAVAGRLSRIGDAE
jgi:DNA-binding CsgD family transcriptional regulator